MQAFAELIVSISIAKSTNEKVELLKHYFDNATSTDKLWLIALFTDRKPPKLISSTLLQAWMTEWTALDKWLWDECYHTVGDLAETVSLLFTAYNQHPQPSSLTNYIQQFYALKKESEENKKEFVHNCLLDLNKDGKFVFIKLITGGFRIGVSKQLVVQALAQHIQWPIAQVSLQLTGQWDALNTTFEELFDTKRNTTDYSKPYPFFLARPLEQTIYDLGEEEHWFAEWKWDGIRCQCIKRNDEVYIWSRGEELITDSYPELQQACSQLPNGTVLDGELMAIEQKPFDDIPFTALPFSQLQKRLNRKKITKQLLQQIPIGFIAYDILEFEGTDIRNKKMAERRLLLKDVLSQSTSSIIYASPLIEYKQWKDLVERREQSRLYKTEGLMLKNKNSVYGHGRVTGSWWKWKINPYSIDAVLLYALKGHGRRSNLYSDYTFALQDGDKLVTFAKAYSGLTDKEMKEVDAFVKANGIEKFGPVRTVKPELVFEIGFEGIAESNRHKCGVAVRFPRILRWRKDKQVSDINTIDDLKQLLHQ